MPHASPPALPLCPLHCPPRYALCTMSQLCLRVPRAVSQPRHNVPCAVTCPSHPSVAPTSCALPPSSAVVSPALSPVVFPVVPCVSPLRCVIACHAACPICHLPALPSCPCAVSVQHGLCIVSLCRTHVPHALHHTSVVPASCPLRRVPHVVVPVHCTCHALCVGPLCHACMSCPCVTSSSSCPLHCPSLTPPSVPAAAGAESPCLRAALGAESG